MKKTISIGCDINKRRKIKGQQQQQNNNNNKLTVVKCSFMLYLIVHRLLKNHDCLIKKPPERGVYIIVT